MSTFNGIGDLAGDTRKYGPREFVFRPGGTREGNVYTDFNELYTDLQAAPGWKVLVFDDSLTSPCIIPFRAGGYDLVGTTVRGIRGGSPGISGTVVTFAVNVIITNLVRVVDVVFAQTLVGTGIIFRYSAAETVHMENASFAVFAAGSDPLVGVTGGSTLEVLGMDYSGIVSFPGDPAVSLAGVGDQIGFYGYGGSTFLANVSGPVGSILSLFGDAASPMLTAAPASFLGSFSYNKEARAERVFVNPAVLGQDTVQDALSALAAASGQVAPRTFVFRPGGVTSGNVYSNFATLYTDLAAASGRKELVFDNSLASPCVIPAGAYDFTNTKLSAGGIDGDISTFALVPVRFTTATTITNLNRVEGLYLDMQPGISIPIRYNSGSVEVLQLVRSVITSAPAANPAILVSGGTTLTVRAFDVSALGGSSREWIQLAGADTLSFTLHDNSAVQDDSILGGVTAVVSSITLDSSSRFNTAQPAFIGAGGLPTFTLESEADRVQVTPSVLGQTEVQSTLEALEGFTTAMSRTLYLGQHGNDSNAGTTPPKAFLTLGAAVTAAIALSPVVGSRVTIRILDAAVYTAAPVTIPAYVDLIGPSATVSGALTLQGETHLVLHRVENITTATPLNIGSAPYGKCWVQVNEVENTSAAACVGIDGAATRAHLEIGSIKGASGGISGALGVNGGKVYGHIGQIEVIGADECIRIAELSSGAPTLEGLTVDRMVGPGTGILMFSSLTGGLVSTLNVGSLETTTAWESADTDLILYLNAGRITGTTTRGVDTKVYVSLIGGTPQTQTVYVSKIGSPYNDGLTPENAVDRLSTALLKATALSPATGNRILIEVLDAGSYTLSADFILPAYVSLNAPYASIDATGGPGYTIRLNDQCRLRAHRIQSTDTAIEAVGGEVRIDADWVQSTSLSNSGILISAGTTSVVDLQIGHLVSATRPALDIVPTAGLEVTGVIGQIETTSGIAVRANAGTPVLGLRIGRIYVFSGTTAIQAAGTASGNLALTVDWIGGAVTTIFAGAGVTLTVICGYFVGTTSGGGTVNLAVNYNAGTPGDWAASAPTNTKDALDRMAAAVAGLLGFPIP